MSFYGKYTSNIEFKAWLEAVAPGSLDFFKVEEIVNKANTLYYVILINLQKSELTLKEDK